MLHVVNVAYNGRWESAIQQIRAYRRADRTRLLWVTPNQCDLLAWRVPIVLPM